MPSRPGGFRLDFDTLLAPVPGDNPCGVSLRYEAEYEKIRRAREQEDPNLAQGVWKRDVKDADWAQVRNLCLPAIASRSKDLQLAVWLMEAMIHLEGYTGLRETLRLIERLCALYWNDLYPEIRDGEVEGRLGPLFWMDEKLTIALKLTPLTAPEKEDGPKYSWADWQSALSLENRSKKDPAARTNAEKNGVPTVEQVMASAGLSPRHTFDRLAEDLGQALEDCVALDALLDQHCGSEAPSLVQFKGVLTAVERWVTEHLKERPDKPADLVPAVMESQTEEVASSEELVVQAPRQLGGEIRSRAEAYEMLRQASDYLMRNEPHSPTPYLVRRAISWGSLSLEELLEEVVGNDNERFEIFRLLRIGNAE